MNKKIDTNIKMIQMLEFTEKYLKEAIIKWNKQLWIKWKKKKKPESLSKETGDKKKNQMQMWLKKTRCF